MNNSTLVPVSTLKYGDYLVGDAGAFVRIVGAIEPSNAMMGCVALETEIGTVYLDEDDEVSVIRSEDHAPAEVWVCSIEQTNTVDTTVHRAEADAYAVVDQYVAEWWDSEKNKNIEPGNEAYTPLPEDEKVARSEYFEDHDREFFTVQSATLR